MEVGIIIYSLSEEERYKINESILSIISLQHSEKKISSVFWETYQGNISASVFVRMPGIQDDFAKKEYATIINMFIRGTEKTLLLDISVDERDKVTNVFFKWIEKNNLNKKEAQKFEEEARKYAESRFFNHLKNRDKKKIGRNEKCPCGSGKKYKKCHALKSMHTKLYNFQSNPESGSNLYTDPV